MIGFSAISSVSYSDTFSSQDNVQRIARLPSLARESSQDSSSGSAGDDEATQLQAKMLEAQIEALQQQLSGLQGKRAQSAYSAGSEGQAESETPPADGINRPTASNQINVYV
ncbi:FlxA-like family protein [Affinibrenneria salicis]|nr:FlxA-like family protein [Affinibrenneria salicis]